MAQRNHPTAAKAAVTVAVAVAAAAAVAAVAVMDEERIGIYNTLALKSGVLLSDKSGRSASVSPFPRGLSHLGEPGDSAGSIHIPLPWLPPLLLPAGVSVATSFNVDL